jgi:hypothetical protein
LVLVSVVHRRCYCSGGALFLFFPGCRRQGRIIQHSAVAGDPCRFGSRDRRQPLVTLERAARCCHHSAPLAGDPWSSLRAVLASHLDSPARLSLTGSARNPDRIDPLTTKQIEFDGQRPPLQWFEKFQGFFVASALEIPEPPDRTRAQIKKKKSLPVDLCYS